MAPCRTQPMPDARGDGDREDRGGGDRIGRAAGLPGGRPLSSKMTTDTRSIGAVHYWVNRSGRLLLRRLRPRRWRTRGQRTFRSSTRSTRRLSRRQRLKIVCVQRLNCGYSRLPILVSGGLPDATLAPSGGVPMDVDVPSSVRRTRGCSCLELWRAVVPLLLLLRLCSVGVWPSVRVRRRPTRRRVLLRLPRAAPFSLWWG